MNSLADKLINSAGRKEWRENWPVVAASTTGYAASVVHVYSMGVMVGPLEEEFGWSRALISSGFLIVSTVVFLFSSFLGMAIDRFGARRIALCGVIAYCLSIALLSTAQQAVWTWWLLWLFVAAGSLLLKPTVWVAAISSLFDGSRGLALAVTLSASGIVSSGGPLLTHLLVENFGWRMAYVLWAGLTATITLPMIFLFFFSAKDKKRAEPILGTVPTLRTPSLSIRSSVKSAAFLKLATASAIVAMLFTALIVNLVPIMTSTGIDKASAAAIAGIVGISQIFGRLTGGVLLDRFDARRITAVVVCFPVVTCFAHILFGGSVPFAIIAAVFFGLSVGVELDAIAYLASRYFGVGNFGALFGTIIGLMALGSGLGPFLANLVYDFTGSYIPVLWVIVPLALISACLLLTLGSYPELGEGPATEQGLDPAPAT